MINLYLFQLSGYCSKLITLVVIATGLAYQFSGFLKLPSSSVAYSTWLEQLLKYQLGVWGAPRESFRANFTPRVTNKQLQ